MTRADRYPRRNLLDGIEDSSGGGWIQSWRSTGREKEEKEEEE